MDVEKQLGVYVSVPFCRAKCSFCNFASGVGTAATIERYVRLLCEEIDRAGATAERLGAELPRAVDTVYFGGGTPSLLRPEQLGRIFAALRRRFEVDEYAEITLEAAPGQIEDDVLQEAMALGVNRVSLGVQSFVDRECAAVGRLHTGEACVAEIRRLRAAGVAEVGVDLIAGLPYQTEASWEESLGVVAELAAEGQLSHASVYLLEVDDDSRLGQEVMAGGTRFHAHGVPQEELAVGLYERACAVLPAAGLEQYEISNFARRPGHASRHNLKYWSRAPYIGFGVDAHSMLRRGAAAVRFANADSLEAYAAGTDREVTEVDLDAAFEEALFLGLRRNAGVDLAALRAEFGTARVAGCTDALREMVGGGMLRQEGERVMLTDRGRMVSNEVFGELLRVVV